MGKKAPPETTILNTSGTNSPNNGSIQFSNSSKYISIMAVIYCRVILFALFWEPLDWKRSKGTSTQQMYILSYPITPPTSQQDTINHMPSVKGDQEQN